MADADLLSEVLEGDQYPLAARRSRREFPKGWEPQVTVSGNTAEATSGVLLQSADERALLVGWRLDPDEWAIVNGSLTVNRWQQHDNCDDWLYQYKAKLVRRVGPAVDLDELFATIGRYKPPKMRTRVADAAMVACLADWQIGKADGDGVAGTVNRILESSYRIVDRAASEKVNCLYLVGMGDLIEQCRNNYPGQAFTVELNRREQMRVARRLLRDLTISASKLGIPVVVSGVGGNHGENRDAGQAYTNEADNDDVALLETVAEVLAANREAFGHVAFHIPDDKLSVQFDIEGLRVGFTHGQKARKGATPQQKLQNWWKDQAFGLTPVGDVDLLVSAHYHHLTVIDHGPRVHMQCPAMDGGSTWWENATGAKSKPGTLTFLVGDGAWDDLKVL